MEATHNDSQYMLQIIAYGLLILYYGVKIIIEVVQWFKKRSANAKKQSEDPLQVKHHFPIFNVISLLAQFIILTLLLRWGIMKLMEQNVFSIISRHKSELLKGMGITFSVSTLAVIIGTTAGSLIAYIITRKSNFMIIKPFLIAIVYVLLSIPALVLILFLWYSGFNNSTYIVSVVALSINLTPFVTKIVASSINNVSADQVDAAKSLGYSHYQIAWHFNFKNVLRNSLQPLLVEYYTTIKLSAFAGIIGLIEVFHNSQDIIRETQDPVSAYIILTLCYIAMVTPLALLADWLENNWRKRSTAKK